MTDNDAASPYRPYLLEIFTWINLGIALVLLRSHGLRINWQTFEYTIGPMFRSLHLLFLNGLVVALVGHAVLRRSPLTFLKQLKRPRWWLDWIRMWLAVLLTTYTYFWLKVNVPVLNQRLWDEPLWRLDILLHLGLSPSILFVELFDGSVLVGWMDLWYTHWKESVMFLISGFLVLYDGDMRRRFTLAVILIWSWGAWLYVAMPALGPIYKFTEHWVQIMASMPQAAAGQATLWANYKIILAGIAGEQVHAFNPTQGIGAMPSIHVAAHCFFALWTWRFMRPIFIFAFIATGLTFVGSILTGWHYAVDGYVGIAFAYFAFRLAVYGLPNEEDANAANSSESMEENEADLTEKASP